MEGGVLTVGLGPRDSWRRFPWALLAGVVGLLASLMSMVLYGVVSPWWLSLTLWVVVAEVAPSVVLSVMPVVRSLRALLWFTASLILRWSVACVWGWALAGFCGSVWEDVQ